ncbi:MAG: HAD family hydrolase [Caldanaerobacter subterraneus]|nr:HAD family hydrolase [Caldanaerobacter subterraneus]
MEILIPINLGEFDIKAAVFDFDGTISTLRSGWEKIMRDFMIEVLTTRGLSFDEVSKEIEEYINHSTGIQTIFQMQWLAERVKKEKASCEGVADPWEYKNEYNKRLKMVVNERIQSILKKDKKPEDYMIKGSKEFLNYLKKLNLEIYLASGTDLQDVIEETKILGVYEFFDEIVGAPPNKIISSKDMLIDKLLKKEHLEGRNIVIFGDGKVEIELGRKVGALTIGVASKEKELGGIDPIKRERLIKAGAHAIIGDFLKKEEILKWIGII